MLHHVQRNIQNEIIKNKSTNCFFLNILFVNFFKFFFVFLHLFLFLVCGLRLQILCHSLWRKLSVFNFLLQPHSIPCQGGWTQVAWFGGKCLYLLSSLASPNVKFLIMKLAVLTLIVIIAGIFPEYRCECEESESRGEDTVNIYMNWDRQSSIHN